MGEATRARALELRDMALHLMRGRGAWGSVRTPGIFLVWEGGDIFMMYWTPRLFPTPFGALPCGLNVAFKRQSVLNIQWANEDDGGFELLSYKPGEWELQLTQQCDDLAAVVAAEMISSSETTALGEGGMPS